MMHIMLSLSTGGMEKFVIDLIPRFDTIKVQSTVCCIGEIGDLSDRLREAGIKIHLVNKSLMGQLRFYHELTNIFRRERVDIAHSYSGVYRDAVIPAMWARVPINIHTDQGKFYPDPDSRRARFNHWFFSHFRDMVVAVSDELRNYLIDEVKLHPNKVTTIYNAVDVQEHNLAIDVNAKKGTLDISQDEKIIGIIARLVPVKDHQTLFLAFKKIRQVNPKIRLLVVGEGPLEQELKNYVSSLSEEKNIIFLGNRTDVKELLHIMDIVCLSSIHEGLSLTLLEAMASARPVIATNVGGNAELVIDGLTGFLVPSQNPDRMAETLAKLLKDEEKRKSMGEMGRRRVEERFNIQGSVKQYEDLYFSLAKTKEIL